jgi:hypothetical protein
MSKIDWKARAEEAEARAAAMRDTDAIFSALKPHADYIIDDDYDVKCGCGEYTLAQEEDCGEKVKNASTVAHLRHLAHVISAQFSKSDAGAAMLERLRKAEGETERLKEKYEGVVKCHRGHTGLPLALWDCPTCVEEIRKERDDWKAEALTARREALEEASKSVCVLCANMGLADVKMGENRWFHQTVDKGTYCHASAIRMLVEKEGNRNAPDSI